MASKFYSIQAEATWIYWVNLHSQTMVFTNTLFLFPFFKNLSPEYCKHHFRRSILAQPEQWFCQYQELSLKGLNPGQYILSLLIRIFSIAYIRKLNPKKECYSIIWMKSPSIASDNKPWCSMKNYVTRNLFLYLSPLSHQVCLWLLQQPKLCLLVQLHQDLIQNNQQNTWD